MKINTSPSSNVIPDGAQYWCAPFYYKSNGDSLMFYSTGVWHKSLHTLFTLKNEPDFKRIRNV